MALARDTNLDSLRDTIVARATAPGAGAIAIVRLSGAASHSIARAIFEPRGDRRRLDDYGRLVLGSLRAAPDQALDEALAVLWKAPHSFTGEDMVEFHVHGSPVVAGSVMDMCMANGARLALPGEFTRRAFLNGKLDLAQAEAVCDMTMAQTQAASRAALAQLEGGLSRELAAIRARLVPVIAELEARVDFPDEGLEFAERERLGRALDESQARLRMLADSARLGRVLRDGARVVLAGKPNAGKSSLFNMLLRRERALVTAHPGTTRDTVEAQVEIGGIPVTLVDTAGLRAAEEEVEALGIARTTEEARTADLVLFVADASDPAEALQDAYQTVRDAPHLVVLNKTDIHPKADPVVTAGALGKGTRLGALGLSAKTRAGVEELEAILITHLSGGAAAPAEGVVVTNRRHVVALERAISAVARAAEGVASSLSPELVVVDLEEAVGALDSITGRRGLDEEVLDAIFSTFCLGK